MPPTFSVKVQGDKKLNDRLLAIARDTKGRPMRLALLRAGLHVERKAKQNATSSVNEGRLRNSITTQVTTQANGLAAHVGTNVKYAPYVEYGTAPHFPPPSALERWVRLKLGVTENIKSVAFLVARKISKKGTSPQPFLGPALTSSTKAISELLRRAVAQYLGK